MNQKRKSRFGLMLVFTVIVFCSLLVNTLVSAVVIMLMVQNDLLQIAPEVVPDTGRLLLFNLMLSVPIGGVIAYLFSRYSMHPMGKVVDCMNELAAGNFKTRVETDGIMWKYPAYSEVAVSVNTLAEELESTEMLRSDFINNFSHEFKSPIVSIAGFAKVLKRGNLSPEQQEEYLTVIEEESMRLSDMATNVLNLTKVENQTILTDTTTYNLSEQIRSCVLLLESKWDQKNLDLQLEFDEHMICANEELLKQVWINLLDNAIKFAPVGHLVQVKIHETDAAVRVDVMNTGSEIPSVYYEKIFGKFYQMDESHSAQGNGVGLAIVKRIVQLHGGLIRVTSADEVTTFTVTLPKR